MTFPAENPALVAAKEAQRRIDEALDAGRSFRLEAGAGAGKTYSLVAALKRLIAERGRALVQTGQKVACITYTEVARNEIAQEIEDHPAILVDTIHGFSWAFLRQFQKALRDLVAEMDDRKEKVEQGGGVGTKSVDYRLWRDLGYAAGALVSGLIAQYFGVLNALWLVAGLTAFSGLWAALRMQETLRLHSV